MDRWKLTAKNIIVEKNVTFQVEGEVGKISAFASKCATGPKGTKVNSVYVDNLTV